MFVGGLDVGTTGCKIAVFDEDGNNVGTYYKEYDVTRKNGLHEIDFTTVLASVKNIIALAAKKFTLTAIGVTSFGETFGLLDENDNILTPSMLYTDPRGENECVELTQKLGEKCLAFKTGVRPHCMYSLPKIMWIKNNMSYAFSKAKRVLLGEDFIIYSLTGAAQIDYSLAERTLGFNIKKKCWDNEIFAAAGIDISLMSKTVPSGSVAGVIKPEAKAELGVDYDITIVNGCHDQIAGMVGAGVFDSDIAMDGIGTVECMPIVMDEIPDDFALYEGGYSVVPHVNGKYACYALSFAGGSTLKWFRDTFAEYEKKLCEKSGKNVYAMLDSSIPINPTGILVLPHFAGAATPYMDSSAKAAMVGLTFEHNKFDIYKALMEGTSYEMLLNLDALKKFIKSPSQIRATGGGATSDAWLQIKSDILGVAITALDCKEVGAAGTALLAGMAVGFYKDMIATCDKMAMPRKAFYPDANNHKLYTEYFAKYKGLYNAIKGLEENV